MAQINAPKPILTQRAAPDDVAHDSLHTGFDRAQMWFEEHRTPVLAALAALVLLVAGVLGWQAWQNRRSAEGQRQLGAAVALFESGNFRGALDGTEGTPGLTEIAERYGRTATGQQARFLAANAHLQLGEADQALALYESYRGDGLLAASALAAQAAILEGQGEHARAAALYQEAATDFESPATTPRFLLGAARAHAAAGDAEAAQAALQQVIDDYADTPEAQTAASEIGRVIALGSATGQATGGVQPLPADTTAASAAGTAAPAVTINGQPAPEGMVQPVEE